MRILFTLSCLLVTAACLNQAVAQKEYGWRKIGDKAPELNVHMMKGDKVSIKEGFGEHVYIVEFWATWCGPCKYSIPHLTYLQKKYKDEGLVVVGISDEPSGIVRPYIDNLGDQMNYSVAIDRAATTKSRYMYGYGTDSLPRAFIVDVNGRVTWHGNPMEEFMEEHIRVLLADVPRSVKTPPAESATESTEDETSTETSD